MNINNENEHELISIVYQEVGKMYEEEIHRREYPNG